MEILSHVDYPCCALGRRPRRHPRRNAAARPHVTLLWPAGPDGQYSLLVDGVAEPPADPDLPLEVRPTTAIRHRVAAGQGPTCLPVTPPG